MSTTFTSKINGNDIYAKRAERTRSGVNLETFTPAGEGATTTYGILPAGITTPTVANDEANTLATQKYVKDAFSGADALVYKGALAGGNTGAYGALTPAATKGDVYKVSAAGKIDGIAVETGDMLICNTDDTAAATAENYATVAANWDVIQVNIDGAVVGPASAVDGNIALFDGTTGKLIKNGANLALSNSPASKAIVTNAQGAIVDADLTTAAPSTSGDTLAFIDSVSQDSQGKITATKKSVTVDSAYSASGTNPVNGTAVAAALATLDADVTSASGTKVQVEVVEADGKVTGVTVTETGLDTALAAKADKVTNAVEGNFAGLDANGNLTDSGHKHSDYKIQQTAVDESGSTLKTLTRIQQNANGVITPTFSDIQAASTSQSGVVQLAGSVGATVSTENNKAASEKAVRDAINNLDATNVTGASNGITVKVSEADGVITNVTVEAVAATAGGDAGLVSYETVSLD